MFKGIVPAILCLLLSSLVYAQNNSLDFDGTDDYVTMGDVLDMGTSNFSIEAWVYIEGAATPNKIISKGLTSDGTPSTAGYGLRTSYDSPLTVDFTIASSGATIVRAESNSLALNTWQHVAGVRDGTNVYLYVNGVNVATETVPAMLNVDTNIPFAIGALDRGNFGLTSEVTDGKIDEVRIWNVARTQAEIMGAMNNELAGTENGLVAYYKFDGQDPLCDVADCNSNQNNGARNGSGGANNTPQYSSAVPSLVDANCGASTTCASLLYDQNNSLDFDGNDDYVTMGDVLDLGASNFSIEAWVYIEGVATPNKIISKGLTNNGTPSTAGYGLRTSYDSPLTVDFTIASSAATIVRAESNSLALNTWQHVAGVRDGTNVHLYVNGVNVATETAPAMLNVDTNIPFAIGALDRGNFGPTSEVTDGKIDEVRIWNVARTQAEIMGAMNDELAGTENGLVAYYKFDGQDPLCDVADCNSNQNNGARNGPGGANNTPQYSPAVPSLVDANCGASTACASLPVRVLDFYGNSNGKSVDVLWETAIEVNNAGFELEKSTDGRNWQTIGFFDGYGTSNETNKYDFKDLTPFYGVNYYRLKQIDFSGGVEYSEVISVDFLSSRGNVQVFPNPSGRNFNIHIDNIQNRQLEVQVLNSLGSVVWKSGLVENVSSYRQELEIDENGIYFIAILIGKEVHAEKLIILNK